MALLPVPGLTDPEQDRESPAMELLEFLADWETEQGEWAGPEWFEDDSFDQLYDEEETGTDE